MKIEFVKNYFIDQEGKAYNRNGMQLKTHVNRHGYEILPYRDDKKFRTTTVHRLVAKAFLENPEDKPCVNHIDGNKQNNNLVNLEWVTYSENTIHALENNLKIIQLGEEVHNSTISNKTAHEICQMMVDGFRNKEIANKLGVSREVVTNIRYKRGWLHISKDYPIKSKTHVVSEETIRWVCERLVEGVRNKDIVDMSTNPKVTKALVNSIKNKKCHVTISDEYDY